MSPLSRRVLRGAAGAGDSTAPAPPTGLSATAGDAQVTLDWDDNSESDLAGYNIYRSATSGGGYSQINGSMLTGSSYTDTTASNGTTYYYVVTALDNSGNESGFSNEDSALPVASSYRPGVGDLSQVSLQGTGSDPQESSYVDFPQTGPVSDLGPNGGKWVNGDTGSDSNSGNSRSSPYKTLGKALANVSAGQRIIVRGSLGPQFVTARFSARVEIFNYGAERWRIDGGSNGLGALFTLKDNAGPFHIKGFEFEGGDNVEATMLLDNSSNHLIEDGLIHGNRLQATGGGAGLRINGAGASNNLIQDVFSYHHGDGSTQNTTNAPDAFQVTTGTSGVLAGTGNAFVRCVGRNGGDDNFDLFRGQGVLVQDCASIAPGFYWTGTPGYDDPAGDGGNGMGYKLGGDPGSGGNTLRGSIVVNGRGNGVQTNGATVACTIDQVTSSNGAGYGYHVDGSGSPLHHMTDDIAFGNDIGSVTGTRDDDNCSWQSPFSDANPVFADPDNGDFSLSEGSLYIGAATDGGNMGASVVALKLLKKYWSTI